MRKLLVVLALVAAGGIAKAQVPPPIDLGIQNIPQQTPVWCWAAVAQQIILATKGPVGTPPQCAMVAIAYGENPGPCCAGDPRCHVTGSLQQIQQLIGHFGGHYSSIAPPADPMTLYATLRAGRPIILAVQSGPASGHVIVLRGMRWDPFYGPILLVNDPMSRFPNEVPFAQIMQVWSAAIVVG